jgi:hypothetical protein
MSTLSYDIVPLYVRNFIRRFVWVWNLVSYPNGLGVFENKMQKRIFRLRGGYREM